MDFVKKAASALGNKDEKKQDGGSGDQGQGQSQQKDDYVDKGKHITPRYTVFSSLERGGEEPS